MPSFFIPLSGLNADSTALNTIANNLSNMNTTGFKSQSVNFSDLFYQQIGSTGSGNAIQLGSGTQVSSIETNFSNGSPNATGVDTDVALQGKGFFVISDGPAPPAASPGSARCPCRAAPASAAPSPAGHRKREASRSSRCCGPAGGAAPVPPPRASPRQPAAPRSPAPAPRSPRPGRRMARNPAQVVAERP